MGREGKTVKSKDTPNPSQRPKILARKNQHNIKKHYHEALSLSF